MLRVAIFDTQWHVTDNVTVDSTKGQTVLPFPDPKSTGVISVHRQDTGEVVVGSRSPREWHDSIFLVTFRSPAPDFRPPAEYLPGLSQQALNDLRNAERMILIVACVSGSGKTTAAQMLACCLRLAVRRRRRLPSGRERREDAGWIPLTDAERWPWLRAIAAGMDERIARGEPTVVACSALKRSYRDLLLGGRPQAQMVFLDVAPEELARRLTARHGHFFPEKLLGTQLDTLDPPQPDEHVTPVAEADEPAATVASIIALLCLQEKGPGEGSGSAGADHEAEA